MADVVDRVVEEREQVETVRPVVKIRKREVKANRIA